MSEPLCERLGFRWAAGLALVGMLSLSGCASEGGVLNTKAKKGAVIGALTGAAAGAAIGGKKRRGGGVLIGAATGALAGGGIGHYLDKQAEELETIPGAEVEKQGDQIMVNFEGGLLFDSGSASLSAGGYERLRSLARTLNNYPRSTVVIKGHTDSQGKDASNQKLSDDRASHVRAFLITESVAAGRLSSIGFGEKLPVATNDTPEGRQQNRRVEIEIKPDSEVLQDDGVQ